MAGFRDTGGPLFIPIRVRHGYLVTGALKEAGLLDAGEGGGLVFTLGFILTLTPCIEEGPGFPGIMRRVEDGFPGTGGNYIFPERAVSRNTQQGLRDLAENLCCFLRSSQKAKAYSPIVS